MTSQLPSYLHFHTDGRAHSESTVTYGDIRLTAITPRLIRIEQGSWTDAATLTVLHRAFCHTNLKTKDEPETLTVDTDELTIRLRKGVSLQEGLTIESKGKVSFCWHFGQKPLQNLKGTVSTLDDINGGCELEDGLCARDGFAFFDDGKTALFTQEGWFEKRIEETDVYFFGYGHDYLACTRDFQSLTGAAELLPAFAFGNWWSRYHAYTQDEYITLMDKFVKKDVPLSVAIIDMDWHLTAENGRTYWDGWTGYTWDNKLFPRPETFLKDLHERGLKTALNLHPAQGVRSFEKPYLEMAKMMGVEDGRTIPFNCLDPQFLKAYFEALHFPQEEMGVDFWWMDWQQGTNYEEIAGESLTDEQREIASITPLWMLNHMHMLAARRNGARGMVFSRYAGYGSGRNPIGFSGDSYSTWEALRFQPYFTATASNVGYGWWSHDIGGHMGGIRNNELMTRWVQLGVFSPILRLHSTNHPFNTREPWSYGPRAEAVVEDYMRLRHRLFPYLYTMNRRSSTEQLPIVMPMYYSHPDCEQAYEVPNEYWFGSEIIAAPITEESDYSDLATADVWLPEGTWIEAQNGLVYKGAQRFAACRTLEEMPLFLKAGAIVPMQQHKVGCNKLGYSDEMELWVAPGANGAFTLYEDDGESLGYRMGHYCETAIAFDWQGTTAKLTVAPASGETVLSPANRTWKVSFRGANKGTTAIVNGVETRASYDEDTATLSMSVQVASADGFEIELANAHGILFDNSDVCERAKNRIMKAEMTLSEKGKLLKRFDTCKADIDEGRKFYPSHLGMDLHRRLGLASLELLEQYRRAKA